VEFIAEDRKQASLAGYFTSLTEVQRAGIAAIALDMWEPYVQAVRAHVPEAATKIVFDKECAAAHSLSYGESCEMCRAAAVPAERY
jgi:transposase